MIDSHCHLDFKQFRGRVADVIAEANSAGVHTLVNIGADLATSRNSVELAEQHDCVYAAVGVHPHDAQTLDDRVYSEIAEMLSREKVVAIGEIGLDFYRDLSPRDIQRKAFRRQLGLAVEHNMPVVIHTREAFEETMSIVGEYAADLPGGVFHCFPGSVDDAWAVFDLGFVVGIGGVVTYKNSRMSRVAAEVPLENMVLETDSPYIAPEPMRGKTNRPAWVAYVCARVAELRGIDRAEVERVTDRACRKLYRIEETFGG